MLFLVLFLGGCEAATSLPVALHPDDLHSYVTPELAQSITPDGRLVLAPPESGAYPQITEGRAIELAVAFNNTFTHSTLGRLEADHGRQIKPAELRIGSPAYFAATPYQPVPASAHAGLRNAFGPYFLIYLVDAAGTPVLSLAVAGYSEAMVENGRVRFPQNYGNDFFVQAVRLGEGFVAPPSPEQAVRLASLATGARVAAVPELVLPSRNYHPVHAHWRVTLDREVTARGRDSGEQRRTRTVFVGLRGQVSVPARQQPDGDEVFDASAGESFRLMRRPEHLLAFERADFPSR
ncbi:MAG TPA: hypothetical protein VHG08_21490 [Longimicrobium sp.]|nr:hypothetical protein [Longimicrobium sp.]